MSHFGGQNDSSINGTVKKREDYGRRVAKDAADHLLQTVALPTVFQGALVTRVGCETAKSVNCNVTLLTSLKHSYLLTLRGGRGYKTCSVRGHWSMNPVAISVSPKVLCEHGLTLAQFLGYHKQF
ncbi:hypothetical protein CEXT_245701 [Caerostris extrusa]|uniref:Uncharacterized protein n=1 Tax=Caerostris extrusa TaxID=172846 RepID=A0AAV4N4A9_CAEEX|nr:hypothetical protein CEXT_245701 [Caerostris extrusa]